MISLMLSFAVLLAGYLVYGRLVEGVFAPAALLARLTPEALGNTFWIVVILAYYVLATLLPIGKITGRLYPISGRY